MSRKKSSRKDLKLAVPKQNTNISDFLTPRGTFQYDDLLLNHEGLRIVSQAQSACHGDVQTTLVDLETVRVIGKGSGGLVQLVSHKWTGEIFALKVIQMNIEETTRKQIVQEVKINRSSQCPYVVICYDAFYDNGVISLVLEYMDRGSLHDVIKQVKVIPEPYLAVICKQVLQGLMYLHNERHVIHRDIKPSNLLLNHKGEAKIADFGVSTVLASSISQRNTFVGTQSYMSPERISGFNYGYDSDTWSLGLSLLECAIGRFPYLPPGQEGVMNFYELLELIVDEPPPFAPSDQFSSEFCSFISACTILFFKNMKAWMSTLLHFSPHCLQVLRLFLLQPISYLESWDFKYKLRSRNLSLLHRFIV